MKNLKHVIVLTVAVVLVLFAVMSRADDQKVEKPKPYPLDTCLVCGMKLGDSHNTILGRRFRTTILALAPPAKGYWKIVE
ncbi:MAG: hypothetical protein ABSC89_08105 [Verrucomicrobiota bacterium]|jgi:hypothetical protein